MRVQAANGRGLCEFGTGGFALSHFAGGAAKVDETGSVRNHTLNDIREVLDDRAKNQLAVLGMIVQDNPLSPKAQQSLREVSASIDTISEMVDSLSEESLHDWKTEYHEAVTNANDFEPAWTAPARL
ncbi:MAG: hypothetical protein RhofKO_30270 [Rhodothermales bacterium]